MVKTKEKKVYDFELPKVKNQLVRVLKKRRNESTIADLVASSGIPKYQVEQTIKVVLNEYRGHLKATESGELLYYFPYGMQNHVKGFIPGLKRFISAFIETLGKVLAFLFKVWIMVMLVGYFVLFLVILIASVLAAIALSAANRDSRDRGGRGGGMFYLVIRLFELFIRIWFYSQIFKDPTQAKKRGRPLHKAVFGFVFGEPDASEEFETGLKKHVLAFIRAKKGVITLEEFLVLTGCDSESGQALINRYMLEFEGEPNVTENGSVIFTFPELLRSAETTNERITLDNPLMRQTIPFNRNEKKLNGWIGFLNAFNLVFGSYFIYFFATNPGITLFNAADRLVIDSGLLYRFVNSFLTDPLFLGAMPVTDSSILIFMVLGLVPIVFSFCFYLIPLIRNILRKGKNEAIKKENFRKRIYAAIFRNKGTINPAEVSPASELEKPKDPARFADKAIKEFAGIKHVDVEQKESGFEYTFPDLKYEMDDVEKYRERVDLSKYKVGKTVFDSGE